MTSYWLQPEATPRHPMMSINVFQRFQSTRGRFKAAEILRIGFKHTDWSLKQHRIDSGWRFRPLPTSSFSTSGCHVWLEDCQTPDRHTWWPVSHEFKLSSTLPRKKMESLEIFHLIRIPSWKAPSFPFRGEHRYLRLLRHFDFRPHALQKELQLNASMKAKEKPWEKPKAWSWRKNQGRFQSPGWENQRGAMSHHHVE